MLVAVVDVELGEDKAQKFSVRWTHWGFHPRTPRKSHCGLGLGWAPGKAAGLQAGQRCPK